MIEVCFSDSEKGTLKVAQHVNSETVTIIGYIGTPPLWKPESGRSGKPLGGESEEVLALSFALDIGEISNNVLTETRKELMFKMLTSPSQRDDREQLQWYEDFWNTDVENLSKLLEYAKNHKHIRVWYSDLPYSVCGLHHVMSLLKNSDCKVTAVKLPSFYKNANGNIVEYTHWSEIEPEKLHEFLLWETEIPKDLRLTLADRWSELQKENSLLRAVINGKLTSVQADFYDFFIRKELGGDSLEMACLIGNVLTRHRLGISDWWLAERIRNMITAGEIKILKYGNTDYANILLKQL